MRVPALDPLIMKALRYGSGWRVLYAGLALIGLGIALLYVSAEVARTGSWWQGTFDAFGVGLVIAGVVDLLAINVLNQVLARNQERWAINRQAVDLLDGLYAARDEKDTLRHRQLLTEAERFVRSTPQLDPWLGWRLENRIGIYGIYQPENRPPSEPGTQP